MDLGLNNKQLSFGLEHGCNLLQKRFSTGNLMNHVESQCKIDLLGYANPVRIALMGDNP